MYKPLASHRSEYLGDKICNAWDQEVIKKKRTGKTPSLLRASIRVFGWEFILLGIILFSLEFFLRYKAILSWTAIFFFILNYISCVIFFFRVQQPQFLGALVQFFTRQTRIKENAVNYAVNNTT